MLFNGKSVSTPLDRTVKLRPDSGKVCDPTRFRQMVGSLIYLNITRPDLSYPVGVISQLMVRPTEEYFQCVQRVLRYVSGTKDRGLLYWTGTPMLIGPEMPLIADPRPGSRSLLGVSRLRCCSVNRTLREKCKITYPILSTYK